MALKKCILIGGAPLTGKTLLARKLASDEHAVRLSTDDIRDWMQLLTRREDYPALFYRGNEDADTYYARFSTPAKIMHADIAQGREVEKGIVALLKSNLSWHRLVIEGIAVTPRFAQAIAKAFPGTVFEVIFLHDANKKRIKQRIFGRGLFDEASRYPDAIKHKEVQYVTLYNKFYKREAEKYGYKMREVETLPYNHVKSALLKIRRALPK